VKVVDAEVNVAPFDGFAIVEGAASTTTASTTVLAVIVPVAASVPVIVTS
jgi:hypothetical protein